MMCRLRHLLFEILFSAFILLLSVSVAFGQDTCKTINNKYWGLYTNLLTCSIIQNTKGAPVSNNPFLVEIIPSFQTNGNKEWQQIYGYPVTGCSFLFGNLGNSGELGNLYGVVPNITFNTLNTRWYAPRFSLGVGLAYFNKPYNETTNPYNIFIGSHVTAMAYAKVFIHYNLLQGFGLNAGLIVSHCSDGHYQMPNVGLNIFSFYLGFNFLPSVNHYFTEKRIIDIPKSKLKINFSTGLGVHVLDLTLGQINNTKYAVYTNDIYLSKRVGMVSNLHAGFEINQYNSYYNFIVSNDYFRSEQKLKSTVLAFYIGHELLIGSLGILTQAGVNLYNPFYDNYINLYKSETTHEKILKDLIPVKLGLQYYLFNPKYNTSSNLFIGAYIKANYAQADFICSQVGFVF